MDVSQFLFGSKITETRCQSGLHTSFPPWYIIFFKTHGFSGLRLKLSGLICAHYDDVEWVTCCWSWEPHKVCSSGGSGRQSSRVRSMLESQMSIPGFWFHTHTQRINIYHHPVSQQKVNLWSGIARRGTCCTPLVTQANTLPLTRQSKNRLYKTVLSFRNNLGSQILRSFELVDVQIRVWRSQPAVVSLAQASQNYGDRALEEEAVKMAALFINPPWKRSSTRASLWCIPNRVSSQKQGRTCSHPGQDSPSWSGPHRSLTCCTLGCVFSSSSSSLTSSHRAPTRL